MLLKLFLILNLGWIFSVSALTENDPPTEEERQQGQARAVERDKEAYVQRMLNQLNTCRATCVAECKARCPSVGSTQPIDVGGGWMFTPDEPFPASSVQACLASCTNAKCDSGICHAKKLTYDYHKKKLDEMLDAREKYEESQKQPESDNPLEQVKKKKKDTKLLAYVGAGTTAFLAYKARACCSQSPSCSSCGMLSAMAGAAAVQTYHMFKKKNDLGETARYMCVDVNDPVCLEDDGGNNNDSDDDNIPMPPGCEAAPDGCDLILPIVNPPPGECPPEEPDCKTKPPESQNPMMPGSGQGPGSLTGGGTSFSDPEKNIHEKLGEAFAPPGGWPEGENPWTKSTVFDYDKMSPDQKKQANKIMASLNKKNKDFLDKQGFKAGSTGSVGGVGGIDDAEESLESTGLNGRGGVGSTGSSGVSAGFGKSVDGSRSVAGATPSDSMSGAGKPKANSIADQMKRMLNKMKGGQGESTGNDGLGYLGDKSQLVGSDYVGVREDNIFMMVHRMNRKLDLENRFIHSISF